MKASFAADATAHLNPISQREDHAEDLEELPSVLDAMIEVLPCPKPPGGYGPLLENIDRKSVV